MALIQEELKTFQGSRPPWLGKLGGPGNRGERVLGSVFEAMGFIWSATPAEVPVWRWGWRWGAWLPGTPD